MFGMRYAAKGDAPYWMSLDRHMAEDELIAKIRDKRAYVILCGDAPARILRYGLFWDNTPFVNLLYLQEPYRARGFGREAMARFEAEMREKGYRTVLTSTQADEEAQRFYRRIGYRDAGCLIANGQEALEIFFEKRLSGWTGRRGEASYADGVDGPKP